MENLRERCTATVRDADAAIVGSYVPEGIAVGGWALNNPTSASPSVGVSRFSEYQGTSLSRKST